MKKIFFVVAIVGMIGLGLVFSLGFFLDLKVGNSKSLVIFVPKGASLNGVSKKLQDKGVIFNSKIFSKVGRYYGYHRKLKYGEYEIKPNFSYQDVLDKITSGDNFRYVVTFIEGDHIYDYARKIEDKGLGRSENFLSLVKNKKFVKQMIGESQASLEGYLFPDTYSFSKTDGEKVIIKTLVRRFFQKTKTIDLKKSGLSRHETLTLASIIEKETGAGFERPIISSVFHNRMKKGMRLQTDPTIIYGILNKTGREITNIRKRDLRAPTPYNTYVIKGLPPGPIANPGQASIRAAVFPEKTKYLYFVSRNNGTHVFSENYKKHLNAVKEYQMNPKKRQGRSWRQLKNKKKDRL